MNRVRCIVTLFIALVVSAQHVLLVLSRKWWDGRDQVPVSWKTCVRCRLQALTRNMRIQLFSYGDYVGDQEQWIEIMGGFQILWCLLPLHGLAHLSCVSAIQLLAPRHQYSSSRAALQSTSRTAIRTSWCIPILLLSRTCDPRKMAWLTNRYQG